MLLGLLGTAAVAAGGIEEDKEGAGWLSDCEKGGKLCEWFGTAVAVGIGAPAV
jgi:hypothetical protein